MKRRVAATRLDLLRSRRLAGRVDKGIALLRRKREALIRELFPLARSAAAARQEIDDTADAAYRAELEALAAHGSAHLAATARPPRELTVDLDVRRVWGTPVAHLGALPRWDRGLAARATGPTATGPGEFEAANRFERLAALVVDAAGRELLLRALGDALSRTSRQLNTLENRVAPMLEERITAIGRALDEREREEHARLRHLRRLRGPR